MLLLLGSDLAAGVDDLDTDLLGPLDNFSTLAGTDVVRNLGAESAVVHKKNVEIFVVVHYEFLQTVWQEELGSVV